LPASAFSVVAWLTGAVAAVAVGMQALAAVEAGLAAGTVVAQTPDAVVPAAPQATGPAPAATTPATTARSARPRPTATSTRSATPSAPRMVSSLGGTAIVRCQGSRAYLVSWSPLADYRAIEVDRGPAATVGLKFRGERREVEIDAWCADGVPAARIEQDDSDESED
jgi:hypothetical protein